MPYCSHMNKLCFSWTLFDVVSKNLEILMALRFFENFSSILKKEEKHSNPENI